MIEITKEEIDDLGLFASVLGHIGDGNFHTSILYNRQDPNERERVEHVVHNMVDRALEMVCREFTPPLPSLLTTL